MVTCGRIDTSDTSGGYGKHFMNCFAVAGNHIKRDFQRLQNKMATYGNYFNLDYFMFLIQLEFFGDPPDSHATAGAPMHLRPDKIADRLISLKDRLCWGGESKTGALDSA